MESASERTAVIILTRSFRIEGTIQVAPQARVTDFLRVAGRFIAVTDAELRDREGNVILTSPFLSVLRDSIEVIVPVSLAHKL